jgi:putative heme-binding domain-containing protein
MRKHGALLLLLAAACVAQQKNPFGNNPQAVEDGRLIFRLRCAACHGKTGNTGHAPDLTLGIYHNGDTDADIYRIVANGSQGTEMPDFLARLGSENVWRVVSYLRSIARHDGGGLRGNAAAGKQLYFGKGNCAMCHMVDGKGGMMGPNLSAVGRTRSPSYMRTALVDPNATLTPGFATITVVTKDGKTIKGTQRGYSNFSAQLMDVSGKIYSFERDEVKSMERSYDSLMPSYKNLSETEVDNLLAYLGSLGTLQASSSAARTGEGEDAHKQ